MEKLELIKIEERNGEQIISGRELHEFLEVKTRYNDWFNRMVEYGFVENVDFTTVTQKRVIANGGYQEQFDHAIKLTMAKELAMIQRTDKGKQARLYFIECEKKLRQHFDEEINNKLEMNFTALKYIADIMNYNENSKALATNKLIDSLKLDSSLKIEYTKSKGILKTLTQLLKENSIELSAKKVNIKLLELGIIEEKERTSKVGLRKYKSIKKLEFGENQVSPKNPKETQPLYYEDKFLKLMSLVQEIL